MFKATLRVLLVLLVILTSVSIILGNTKTDVVSKSMNTHIVPHVKITQKKKIQRSSTMFLQRLAHQESGNDYKIVSNNNMMGKYQFSKTTLRGLKVDVDSFLQNEAVQDSAMIRLLRRNYNVLKPYIKKYAGTTKDGVMITSSGLLAGAHLVGPGGVISWLTQDSTHPLSDTNGMHVSTYVKKFGNFNLNNLLHRAD